MAKNHNTAFKQTHNYYCCCYYYYCFTALWILSRNTKVSRYQKRKTRKVKPIWIYWSKRQWVAVASAGQYANQHLNPDR